eukprot:CAMPEP_0183418088 /NCGR_PEP_ID=MMETSP0370-20130417/24869_1 /TAXON_ID=268820 /ORGANISM="Peridinium aciculiferum, Strain PAER-2" /LENGTH=41 /DNA_ID= /DNA_START= /DNA_END= /DNA_ORIENTATION=
MSSMPSSHWALSTSKPCRRDQTSRADFNSEPLSVEESFGTK